MSKSSKPGAEPEHLPGQPGAEVLWHLARASGQTACQALAITPTPTPSIQMACKRLDAHLRCANSISEPADTEHSLGSTKFFLTTASEAPRQHQPAYFIHVNQLGQPLFVELDPPIIFKHMDRKPMPDRRSDNGRREPLTILEPDEEFII
ncbi:hypothetical protein UIB01_02070 [Stutzerimonas decontaminans]|uniref:Uncharacterized protein n=1 Tax=Stutzerimonas stutzeri TaxID=316 RepID=A0A023WYD7_STUST|nr:hypothetical protein UIB01_02070 [Stutzerimonas decontaminans]